MKVQTIQTMINITIMTIVKASCQPLIPSSRKTNILTRTSELELSHLGFLHYSGADNETLVPGSRGDICTHSHLGLSLSGH